MRIFTTFTSIVLSFFISQAQASLKAEIADLEAVAKKDELIFISKKGPLKLLELYLKDGQFDKALELIQSKARTKIAPADRADYEFLMWKIYSHFIPKNKGFCVLNPLTDSCDEGEDLPFIAEMYQENYPQNQHQIEMNEIAYNYYQYKLQHETIKLNLFIDQFEGAVHPSGIISQFLTNTVRGNDKRTDGKVWANCVGEHENGLPGKCDLVYKVNLITRILGQASHIEEFAKSDDLQQYYQTKMKYLELLKTELENSPELKKEVHSQYLKLNLEQEVEKYRRLLN